MPYIEVRNNSSRVEHEATTSKVDDDQLFYCRSRGMDEEEAVALVVNGFCKEGPPGPADGIRDGGAKPGRDQPGRLGRLSHGEGLRSDRVGQAARGRASGACPVIDETQPRSDAQADAQSFELTFAETEREVIGTYYAAADVILEYGSGGSTVLAAELGRRVISVESDAAWAARMTEHLAGVSDKASGASRQHRADGRVGVGRPMRATTAAFQLMRCRSGTGRISASGPGVD